MLHTVILIVYQLGNIIFDMKYDDIKINEIISRFEESNKKKRKAYRKIPVKVAGLD